jgi:flagellar hook-associated protein FlgK
MHSLATDIEKAIEEASSARGRGLDYKVSYDEHTQKFRVSEGDGSDLKQVNILWSESNSAKSLGFDPFDETYTVSDGEYGHGDNRNSLGIADQQFETSHHSNWAYKRGQASTSDTVETTVEGFYQGLISSLGIESASIDRGFTFSEGMIEKLEEQRDNISGVSLDEEMINLMRFQQSYNAASKLLKTADEMLTSLLAIR